MNINDNKKVCSLDGLIQPVKPFIDIAASTSFKENITVMAKHSLDNLMTSEKKNSFKEKVISCCSVLTNSVSHRFDYLKLLTISTIDFVASLVASIGSSVIGPFGFNNNCACNWRHTGLAFGSILTSAVGLVNPKVACMVNILFYTSVLTYHGSTVSKNTKDVFNNFVNSLKELNPLKDIKELDKKDIEQLQDTFQKFSSNFTKKGAIPAS